MEILRMLRMCDSFSSSLTSETASCFTMRKNWGVILDWPDVKLEYDFLLQILKYFLSRLRLRAEIPHCTWRLVDATWTWCVYWSITERTWIPRTEKAKRLCTSRQLKEMSLSSSTSTAFEPRHQLQTIKVRNWNSQATQLRNNFFP